MSLCRAALLAFPLVAFALVASGTTVRADEPVSRDLVIENHKFQPAEIHVPAGQAVAIQVDNRDDTAEEFDSTSLKVEKVIAGGRKSVVRLHPLTPGRYPFMGEYHSDTAQGFVVAE